MMRIGSYCVKNVGAFGRAPTFLIALHGKIEILNQNENAKKHC